MKLGRKKFYIHFTHQEGLENLDQLNLASKCLCSNSCPALIFVLQLCEFL
jgi:hypothetical protein